MTWLLIRIGRAAHPGLEFTNLEACLLVVLSVMLVLASGFLIWKVMRFADEIEEGSVRSWPKRAHGSVRFYRSERWRDQ